MSRLAWLQTVLGTALLGIGGLALADTVMVGTIPRSDVTVTAVRDGQVEITISGRKVDPLPVERVTRIIVDADQTFTKADQAFAEGQWEQAATNYQQALRQPSKPWMKNWGLPRMLQAANKAGRIEISVPAFVQLLEQLPQDAMRLRPEVPADAAPAALTQAAADLNKAASGPNVAVLPRQAILSVLMDVQRVQGDLAGAGKVAEQLLKLTSTDARDPANARVAASLHLGLAQLALSQKDYAKAIEQINANRELFTDPAAQAEALYVLALAKDAKAGGKPGADVQKDIAVDYMRAVAAARQADGKYLPECLMRVAELEEQVGQIKPALALYAEVANGYKQSPLAAKAARELARLKQNAAAQ